MRNMLDIVMQGPIFPGTLQTARSYLEFEPVNKVIISTWVGEPPFGVMDRIEVIHSNPLPVIGLNNVSRHVHSSHVGLQQATAPLAMKTRTDQCIKPHSLSMMYDYFFNNSAVEEKFLDGTGPKGTVFTIGMYTNFVFHPEDHLFMGWREDIQAVFNIPLDTVHNHCNPEFCLTHIRPNAYIGMHYFAKFDARIAEMIKDPKQFIVDGAPGRAEAIELYNKYRDRIMKPFPRIDLWWEKYKQEYPYEVGKNVYSEYWAE